VPSEIPYSQCVHCRALDDNFCNHLVSGSYQDSGPRAGSLELTQFEIGKRKPIPVRARFSSASLILCEGWAFRYRQLSNAQRQILSILIPGDFFSVFSLFETRPAYSVETLTDVRFCQINRADFMREMMKPHLFDKLGKLCAAEYDEIKETILNLGQRDGPERVVHFITRLAQRLEARGLALGDRRYPFPLTSAHIADAVGLIPEEVDDTLALLSRHDIMKLSGDVLSITEPEKLEDFPIKIEA
jgi:CRP/FNR family transcriptional regulator, anaerobic regulatory protein